ncbi:uncharacterized protein PGTG_20430 [Puccinia graminis f. sp. tritici CRL 75-36-700-3]|uniref:Uncharacterized protein n=1 Tax=Puccinia graminis f. sp. tritici (strain CRL 75-36-700-3 / race SCCL) TaxID=418459 RepID=E3NY25_PUCGT|nr:uncharacterized protein PGTG_20430 [Puccinia graminis f. sp. tritici CRL 75-36-700-3]EFP94474.1 hypothetical protein PGTG_20430 [Puccinia graminis f. sp. tritici CRL 75-36-700-3]
MVKDVLRFWIERSQSNDLVEAHEAKTRIFESLDKYGEMHPKLYPIVLLYFASAGHLQSETSHQVCTLNGREVLSWTLSVYTLNGQECFSWPSRVYILKDREKDSWPSTVCNCHPGGILVAAWALLGLPTPKTPWVLEHQPPTPLGVGILLIKFCGDLTPKPTHGFGGLTPIYRGTTRGAKLKMTEFELWN